MKVNIVCLKWGQRYDANYVNQLYRGIQRNLTLPFDFYCFTDSADGLDPSICLRDISSLHAHDCMKNTVYVKYSILHSFAGLQGPTLFCDIDLMILGSLDEFFTFNPGQFCIIHNWIAWRKTILRPRPRIGNSSVFRFEAGTTRYNHVLERYLENPQLIRRSFSTEQAFLSHCVAEEMTFWPSEWVQSFKADCTWTFPFNLLRKPVVQPSARILVFHGRPDPHEAISGYQRTLRKKSLPMPELARFWEAESLSSGRRTSELSEYSGDRRADCHSEAKTSGRTAFLKERATTAMPSDSAQPISHRDIW